MCFHSQYPTYNILFATNILEAVLGDVSNNFNELSLQSKVIKIVEITMKLDINCNERSIENEYCKYEINKKKTIQDIRFYRK